MPSILAGLLYILLGLLLAAVAKRLAYLVFSILRIESRLGKAHLMNKHKIQTWEHIIADALSYLILVVFLIPAFDAWNLTAVSSIVASVVAYAPELFVALMLVFIGMVLAEKTHDVVLAMLQRRGSSGAVTIAKLAQYAVLFMTVLVVMYQLDIARELVNYTFAGFIIFAAIAGGIAFGLGGKDSAHDLIEKVKTKI